MRATTALVVALFLCASPVLPASGGEAPAPSSSSLDKDREAIRQVLRRYLDVTEKKDQGAIAEAFHPAAKLLLVGKNGLREMSQSEWWERVSRIPGTVERKSTIALVDVTGIAAVARIDFERSTDYFSLLKIDGHWKIVNKVLSTPL